MSTSLLLNCPLMTAALVRMAAMTISRLLLWVGLLFLGALLDHEERPLLVSRLTISSYVPWLSTSIASSLLRAVALKVARLPTVVASAHCSRSPPLLSGGQGSNLF